MTTDAGLPRVPLPSLESSARQFLAWCEPLLTTAQLADTRRAVDASLAPGGPVHQLQQLLEARESSQTGESWLDEFWDQRYLGRRDRIALNANFFFLLAPSPLGPVERAAHLTRALVDHKMRLDAGLVAPTVSRGRPLSMAQLDQLYSTTRIPGIEQDTTRSMPGQRHVAVLCRGHVFRMDVLDRYGRPIGRTQLGDGFEAVVRATATPAETDAGVGALTAQPRADWAANRASLVAHPGNAASLEQLETALFCVCLDDSIPADRDDACRHLLAGDPRNRWFDKSLSLIVLGDGTAGFNSEHARLDGSVVVEVIDALQAYDSPGAAFDDSEAGADVVSLPFTVDADLRVAVEAANSSFTETVAGTVTLAHSFTGFGGTRVKELGVSPDAFSQMAFQLANQRARGRIGATYESIATRQFRYGRTEAMRVVTPEMVRWVSAMDDPGATHERLAALLAAAGAHTARVRQCRSGLAPEQHLWELQMLRQRHTPTAEHELPIFGSPGWLVMRDDDLSTSSVASPAIEQFGFGPTNDHCIGIAYHVLPDRFSVFLSAHRGVDLPAYAGRLDEALSEMAALLATQGQG
jgi:carnitine O-acetyltransferase